MTAASHSYEATFNVVIKAGSLDEANGARLALLNDVESHPAVLEASAPITALKYRAAKATPR